MAKQDDNTAPASEALAAWDKLFNERETLNGNLDCCNDASFHQPEGKVPAETARELATAAILLEQTNTLLDRVSERQSRRPAVTTDQQQAACEPESKSDTDDRVYELQIYLEDIAGVASIAAEACDDPALLGTCNTIERECLAVKDGLDDFLGLSGKGSTAKWHKAALREIDRLATEYAEKTPQECAAKLRRFNYDVAENLAADITEDGYTVTKTWTRKGVRYFLAEREFMERLLSEDYEAVQLTE